MKKPILDRSRPKISVKDFQPAEVKNFLRTKLLAKGIEEAYLFGSLAKGAENAWSDLDVVIVMKSNKPFADRGRDFDDLFELGLPVDILVYTPEEFEEMRQSGSGFWREFERQKVRIV